MKLLKKLSLGALAALVTFVAVAQTPTIFNLIRVNTGADIRGIIENQTGVVTVDDDFEVTGDAEIDGTLTVAALSVPDGALTRVNDTNVTLTLGGDPNNALLAATSLTLGWSGQLAVGRGGTGASTLTGLLLGNGTSAFTALTATDDSLVVGNGTTYQVKAVPDCDDTGGNHLNYDTSSNAFSCGNSGGGGGGAGSAAGADTQVQYNNGGALGGDTGLTFDNSTDDLTVGGEIVAASSLIGGVADTDYARLSQGNTFTGADQTVSNSGGVSVILSDPGAGVNEKNFQLFNSASSAGLRVLNDALSGSVANPFSYNLSTDSLALSGSGGLTLNGVASSDFARLSQSNVFTQNVESAKSNPVLILDDTDGSSGGLTSYLSFQGTNAEQGFVGFGGTGTTLSVANTISGGELQLLSSGGGLITGNAVDMTPSSGTFTLNYTNGCGTTPTQSARWYKIGASVTITVAAAIACTADTTVFDTDADIPAAIRPTVSNVYGPHVGANDNGSSVTAMVEIATNGEIIVNRCGAVTGTCDGGAWTGSGNRGLDAWTVSYVR